MEITNIKIYPFKKKLRNIVAVCQISFDDELLVTGVELCERNGKYYIFYPKNPNNKHNLNFYQPRNKKFANYILDRVLNEYDSKKNECFDTFAAKEVIDQWNHDYTDAIVDMVSNVDPDRILPIDDLDIKDEKTQAN